MTLLFRVIRVAAFLPIALACSALMALMVMTFCDVVLRSSFNAPIEAATELTRVLMAVIVFSVLPAVSARGEHIAVDLADPLIYGLGLSRLRDGLMHLAGGVMLIWPIGQMWKLTERAGSYGDVTEYLAIPQVYVGAFITFFAALAALAMIITGILTLVAPKKLKAML